MEDKTTQENDKSIGEKILAMDRRILHTFLFILVILPLVFPLALPVPITDLSLMSYDMIENIPEDSIVLCKFDIGSSYFDECQPGTIALGQHLFNRPLKLVFIAFWASDAPGILLDLTFPKIDFHGKEYGKDYVFLGYVLGGETAMAALGSDVHSLISTDYFGDPIEDMPLMQEFKSAEDLSAIVMVGAGDEPIVIRQLAVPYDLPFVVNTMANSVPILMPYVKSGQIDGIVNGLRGGAEYELLINKPGLALSATDAISLTHLLVVAVIIIGNLAYFESKRTRHIKKNNLEAEN